MLDLQYYLSFGALFDEDSEPGIAYTQWSRDYMPNSNCRLLARMQEQFCAEGNGVTAAIRDVDAAKYQEYCKDTLAGSYGSGRVGTRFLAAYSRLDMHKTELRAAAALAGLELRIIDEEGVPAFRRGFASGDTLTASNTFDLRPSTLAEGFYQDWRSVAGASKPVKEAPWNRRNRHKLVISSGKGKGKGRK